MPAGSRRNTPMRLNRKPTLPVLPRLPPPLLSTLRTLATVRVGLSVAASIRMAMPCGRVALVDDLLVVGDVLARGALDRRLDLVLRHVDRAGVLDDAAQLRVAGRVGTAGLDRDHDLLADAREGLGHAVPAGEHRVLAGFEDASHRRRSLSPCGIGFAGPGRKRPVGAKAATLSQHASFPRPARAAGTPLTAVPRRPCLVRGALSSVPGPLRPVRVSRPVRPVLGFPGVHSYPSPP